MSYLAVDSRARRGFLKHGGYETRPCANLHAAFFDPDHGAAPSIVLLTQHDIDLRAQASAQKMEQERVYGTPALGRGPEPIRQPFSRRRTGASLQAMRGREE
jgi:hypothetical protein